jgi:hypothetical protein
MSPAGGCGHVPACDMSLFCFFYFVYIYIKVIRLSLRTSGTQGPESEEIEQRRREELQVSLSLKALCAIPQKKNL